MPCNSLGNALFLLRVITQEFPMTSNEAAETNPLIEKAVEVVGSKAALARAVGVKPPTVHQWINRERPVPAGKCRAIESATSGAVTAEELRPDIFTPDPKPKTEAA
jgi:DNA-binding transcriptional regulator YdaS (Cro superfamily)